mmetsp:Transcript_5521/g.13841  ORF Transcript_5521/g.13841 Transcript_5521/m.13841 type:complete len:274 (+) Transcript_5521:28-849(+)
MSDPFRRLFLDQVELTIKREPSRDSLLVLLQLALPGLANLGSAIEMEKSFKTLRARAHPDKHPQDVLRATRIYQDAQSFYHKCITSSSSSFYFGKASSKPASPTNVNFPLEFNSIDKWPHIEYQKPWVTPELTKEEMSRAVAYQCLNARGAIAHGQKIERKFNQTSVCHADVEAHKSVEQMFSLRGGAKELSGINEIKEELRNNGPVVSTSFRPSEMFLSSNTISKSDHGHQSDILIVGWRQLSSGEVWIVQPLYYNGGVLSQVVYVAVMQFE